MEWAMRKAKPTKSLLLVEWSDAWSNGVWSNVDYAKEQQEGLIVTSIGYLLQANRNGVTLARESQQMEHQVSSGSFLVE